MRLFLDTEFNGFGGRLMSMALVPENESWPEFYEEIEIRDQIEPWVQTNVVPHMFKAPITYSQFQSKLSEYLLSMKHNDITIVADWPDDIRYFMEATITGPGNRIMMPTKIKFELDLSIDYDSDVPHNALHDARGIRKSYLGRS
jgi:hypothetical protein